MEDSLIGIPRVSIVLCTNRCDQFFDAALYSLEHQTFNDLEILIIVNGMNDSEFERLKKRASLSHCRVLRSSVSGVTFSRNLGLEYCKAPLVAVMDADDIAYPERISHQVDFMDTHPEISICGSSYDVIGTNGEFLGHHRLPLNDKEIRTSFLWSNPICHPSVIYRKELITRIGGYSGNSAEDYELWLRLLEEPGIRFANISKPLIGYRVPVVSLARRSRRAYVHVAGAQVRAFILTKNPIWLLAGAISVLKAWFRATRE